MQVPYMEWTRPQHGSQHHSRGRGRSAQWRKVTQSERRKHRNEHGYNTNEMMQRFIDHLVKYAAIGSRIDRALLVMDNVSMHVSPETLKYFSKNNIDIVTYPPNCTDELQGLDKVLFKPMKTMYSSNLKYRLSKNWPVNRSNFPIRWEEARDKAWDKDLIKKAFKVTGVWPLNRNAISPHRIHDAVAIRKVQDLTVNSPSFEDTETPYAQLLSLVGKVYGGIAGGEYADQFLRLKQQCEEADRQREASRILVEDEATIVDPLEQLDAPRPRARRPRKQVETLLQMSQGSTITLDDNEDVLADNNGQSGGNDGENQEVGIDGDETDEIDDETANANEQDDSNATLESFSEEDQALARRWVEEHLVS
ncbi:hypothetical protein CBS101457_002273 [Exobasidium rhododendri]|nr:hypothetical protein CBS101457_002273 [Exobasidium rhododendri]